MFAPCCDKAVPTPQQGDMPQSFAWTCPECATEYDAHASKRVLTGEGDNRAGKRTYTFERVK